MQLKNTLEICAEAARNRRLNRYHIETGDNPSTHPGNPLLGHCFENTRETSWELAQREIPHRIVRGAIAHEAVSQYPYWLIPDDATDIDKALPSGYDDIVSTHIDSDTGAVDPDIWEIIEKPTTTEQLPDEANQYWIEVDGEEISRFDSLETFVVDTVAEARQYYGESKTYTGHPTRFYLKPTDGYTQPWERHDEWEWNPRKPHPY